MVGSGQTFYCPEYKILTREYNKTIVFHSSLLVNGCHFSHWFTWKFSIVSPRLAAGYVNLHTCPRGSSSSKMSSMTKEGQACKRAAMQAKEHTLVGNIFHTALSQHFQRRTLADPFEVYRALRVVNPSSYMAYLQVH